MAPSLEYVFTFRAYINPEVTNLGSKISGSTRLITNDTCGSMKFSDPDIEVQLIQPSADWFVVDSVNNVVHVVARLLAKTDEGAIYVTSKADMEICDATQKILSGAPDAKSTEFGDITWFSRVAVETTDTRLKWMETGLLVGQGRCNVDEKGLGAEYLVYRCKN
ncbi:hypothetical protein M426DRAFT_261761 [Hypoxylon sp. CI-4A]|nr:hypothetical protein M426DRAFT_261761 [Hypoxylon sp. CI-4A]